MSKIFLHRLDVIPCPQAVDRIGVAKIVEPKLCQPQLLHDLLVVHIHGLVVDIPPGLGGENQIFAVLPAVPQKLNGIQTNTNNGLGIEMLEG